MNKTEKIFLSPWDIASAVMAMLLLANFLVFAIVCAAAIEIAFDLVEMMVTGVLLLLGLILLPLARKYDRSKIWKRLLLAGVIGNGLIVLCFCAAFAVLIAAWQ